MSESNQEKLDRLTMMATGNPKWDLSPNDIEAIAYALKLISFAEDVAEGRRQGLDGKVDFGPFTKDLQDLINRRSLENLSDTPDHILAEYLTACLINFSYITKSRDEWWNHDPWGKKAEDGTH